MTSPERPNWWATLPGILTGIAAVITATVALLGTLQLLGVIGQKAPADRQDTAGKSTPGAVGPSSEGEGEGTPGASPNLTVAPPTRAWTAALSQGVLSLKHGDKAGLKSGVVGGTAELGDILTGREGTGYWISVLDSGGGSTYLSAIATTPDKAACVTALAGPKTAQIEATPQSVGQWWCIRTRDGYTGAIQVSQIFQDAPQRLVLNYVLWK